MSIFSYPPNPELDALAANVLRGLAIDEIQRANSGHPGMPLGMADAVYVLWTRFLKYDPSRPDWPDRDRFVLSAGHGSSLLYALLHLSGVGLGLDDLRAFRQLGSRTPGHPERGVAPMVETTTGPLGQGLATAVGMALAERFLRERFGPALCDHHTYVVAGDGDLMEGVSYEAASLAGHLGLGRLVVLYDDNRITIDGSTDITFTEDRLARFEAQGWQVLRADGRDQEQVARAIEAALADPRPSLIACRTQIGWGSPHMAGRPEVHGTPLGEDELRLTKQRLGLDPDTHFQVPPRVYERFRARDAERRALREAWESRLAASPLRGEWERWMSGQLAGSLDEVDWPRFEPGAKVATRKASGQVIAALARALPNLLGGAADLAASCKTDIPGEGVFSARDARSRNLAFGIREHAMGAICNGLALHGGLLPYCATFLVFNDYMRPAVRLAAMMRAKVVLLYTHDSVYLGEDGPTHQPVEQIMALRLVPGLTVIRPADASEVPVAWRLALEREGPTAILLSRQGMPVFDRSRLGPAEGLARGGYVFYEPEQAPRALLLATGSELALALDAARRLEAEGLPVRVVNLGSWELFEEQPADYRAEVLPPGLPRVAVEAGRSLGWERYTLGGPVIGIDRFGESAPGAQVAAHLGLTVEAVVEALRGVLA